ncbi:PREDICTED: uncharacterized protein DDB_G0271670 [Tarenaya hassleriana]|uniref:uncharacterized protein DDB_G0271670 n=1 Tax=Tarenaya hassleriana TaxID=28532 RepID=UPI00053C8A10|nr:PREDICTED: uncharacterized protein DDB_G0271670 [Tarenaya hassleriana]
MRVTDIFCSSPASTAVRSSTVHHSGDSTCGGRRPFERRRTQNPNSDKFYVRCMSSSEMPSIPLPRQMSCRSSFDVDPRRRSSAHGGESRRKSSADASDLRRSKTSLGSSSSRYLLKDHKLDSLDKKWLSLDYNDRSKDLIPLRDRNVTSSSSSSSCSSSSSSSSMKAPSSAQSPDQVVVLRVSIHCKGCEGKVRKHISKMEGVTSFDIDLATKKVTVVGNVTPLGVLNSISKVKFAQFWPPSSSSSPSLRHSHNSSLLSA